MPAEFEMMRKKIEAELIKKGEDAKAARKKSFAMATAQWKKSHDGMSPDASESSPIEWKSSFSIIESGEEVLSESDAKPRKWATIGGTALTETVSTNKRKYSINNILENDGITVPVFSEHRPVEDHVVGRATFKAQAGKLVYEGKIRNTSSHPDIVEKAQDGLLSVSIGASQFKATPGKDGVTIIESLKINHLGIVGVPGVSDASIEYAIAESFADAVEKASIILTEDEDEEIPAERESGVDEGHNSEGLSMEELEALKEQIGKLQESLESMEKRSIVERIVELNKDLKESDLMGKSKDILEMVYSYEKKLVESAVLAESVPDKVEGAGSGIVESAPDKREDDGLVESDTSVSMSKSYYEKFNKDVRESMYR